MTQRANYFSGQTGRRALVRAATRFLSLIAVPASLVLVVVIIVIVIPSGSGVMAL